MEELEEAGISLGLDAESARLLTIQTALGAARMAMESSLDPEAARARDLARRHDRMCPQGPDQGRSGRPGGARRASRAIVRSTLTDPVGASMSGTYLTNPAVFLIQTLVRALYHPRRHPLPAAMGAGRLLQPDLPVRGQADLPGTAPAASLHSRLCRGMDLSALVLAWLVKTVELGLLVAVLGLNALGSAPSVGPCLPSSSSPSTSFCSGS